MLFGIFSSLAHRIIVIAGHAYYLCPVRGNGLLTTSTDMLMDIDHALATGILRAPSHRAAMIAIGRAGHGQTSNKVLVGRTLQIIQRQAGIAGMSLQLTQQQTIDGISTAQSLEAAQTKTTGLILVIHPAHLHLRGQAGQMTQRSRRVTGPLHDAGLSLLEGGYRQNRLQGSVVFLAVLNATRVQIQLHRALLPNGMFVHVCSTFMGLIIGLQVLKTAMDGFNLLQLARHLRLGL